MTGSLDSVERLLIYIASCEEKITRGERIRCLAIFSPRGGVKILAILLCSETHQELLLLLHGFRPTLHPFLQSLIVPNESASCTWSFVLSVQLFIVSPICRISQTFQTTYRDAFSGLAMQIKSSATTSFFKYKSNGYCSKNDAGETLRGAQELEGSILYTGKKVCKKKETFFRKNVD